MKVFRIFLFATLLLLFNSLLKAQNESISTRGIVQRLDSIVVIGGDQKIEYFYGNSGYHVGTVTYQWSDEAMKYEQDLKNEFTYNLEGLCYLNQSFKWDKASNQWLPYNQSEMIYDENNQLLSDNHFLWNQALSAWDLETKMKYRNTYDSIGKLTAISQLNNLIALDTTLVSKYVYTYNDNESLKSVMLYKMGREFMELAEKDEYFYDSEGNLTSTQSSVYHNRRWYLRGKDEFTYNTLIAVNQLLIPKDYFASRFFLPAGYLYGSMITSRVHAFGSTIWTKLYYYSPFEVTALNELETIKPTVFPNPASNYLDIHWIGSHEALNIELLEITGRKVFGGRIQNNSKFPIHAYRKGWYIVKILEEDKILETKKVYFY